VASVILIGVLNRLLAPASELRTWEWHHRLYLPELEGQLVPLQQFYRALDALMAIKEPLEAELFGQVRHLFNQELDVVFYDLTSTYFEGSGPPSAAYGYSRDRRPDRRQIVVAVLTDAQGLPLGFEVFPGNQADVTTLSTALQVLQERFRIGRCIFVGDSGLFSADNLDALQQAGYPYVLAVRRRALGEHAALVHVPLSAYQSLREDLLAYEGPPADDGSRVIVCFSEPRRLEQQQIRQQRLDRGQASLEALQRRVAQGRLRDARKIAAAASRSLAEAKAGTYFCLDIPAEGGQFDFRLHQERLQQETQWDGKYFLHSNVPHSTPEQTVDAYFGLQRVERAFRGLKDYLRVRPIYHYREQRVRGHVFVAVLAYLLLRSLELKLAQGGCPMSGRRALDLLGEIHAVEIRLGPQQVLTLTQPSPQAHELLHALKLAPLPRVLPALPSP
jgi:transposase